MKGIQEITKAKKLPDNLEAVDVLIGYCSSQKILIGYFLLNNKDSEYTRDRKIASYIVSQLTNASQDEIAKLFNRENQSSISRFISWVKKEYESNKGFQKEYKKILDKVCEELSM